MYCIKYFGGEKSRSIGFANAYEWERVVRKKKKTTVTRLRRFKKKKKENQRIKKRKKIRKRWKSSVCEKKKERKVKNLMDFIFKTILSVGILKQNS